jgi:hypothetical protein
MQTPRITMLDYALLLLAEAVDALHLAFWSHIVPLLADDTYVLTQARFTRLMNQLFESEARLARAIVYAAIRIAGLPWRPLPLADFMRPTPRSGPAAAMRLTQHARRLRDARKLALRLAERIRAALEPKPARPDDTPRLALIHTLAWHTLTLKRAIPLPRPAPQPRAPPELPATNLHHLAA